MYVWLEQWQKIYIVTTIHKSIIVSFIATLFGCLFGMHAISTWLFIFLKCFFVTFKFGTMHRQTSSLLFVCVALKVTVSDSITIAPDRN